MSHHLSLHIVNHDNCLQIIVTSFIQFLATYYKIKEGGIDLLPMMSRDADVAEKAFRKIKTCSSVKS